MLGQWWGRELRGIHVKKRPGLGEELESRKPSKLSTVFNEKVNKKSSKFPTFTPLNNPSQTTQFSPSH